MLSFLLYLLPHHLRHLLERKERSQPRVFLSDVAVIQSAPQGYELPLRPTLRLAPLKKTANPKDFPLEPAPKEPWYSLTLREREVTALVYMGHRNYEIAETLGVGYGTIQTHLQHIFDKFGLRSRKELRRALQGWQAEAWWADNHR